MWTVKMSCLDSQQLLADFCTFDYVTLDKNLQTIKMIDCAIVHYSYIAFIAVFTRFQKSTK